MAQCGDAGALGLLLARHRAGMRAVALNLLGYGPDAEDAVQDAALVAVQRIGDVRDPDAVGPWLRMIVRNACRMHLRANRRASFTGDLMLPSDDPHPEQVVEQHALRDWIWHVMEELSPPLRLAVMLRYFSGITSYDQIAAACEVPVGTIRSRLHQARAKMAQALLETAALAHDDAAELTAARRREGIETLASAERGEFATVVAERWSPEVELIGGQGQRGGKELLLRAMDSDLESGVRQRLVHVVAGRDLTIWEMDVINPPDNPEHCPSAVAWLLSLREGRIQRLRLFHPQGS
jgi:RNA polymerase sigma-70 factor (ECF subfamily)